MAGRSSDTVVRSAVPSMDDPKGPNDPASFVVCIRPHEARFLRPQWGKYTAGAQVNPRTPGGHFLRRASRSCRPRYWRPSPRGLPPRRTSAP